MRHRVSGRRLGRDGEHRLAMRRNMVASLFEYETISTTIERAKEVRPFAEKLITLAKKGTLAARRRAISLLGNRDIVGDEAGGEEQKGTVIGKLFNEIGPRYLDRPGGYTRIVRLAMNRLGDNGKLVLLQLVGVEGKVKKEGKPSARKKAVVQPQAQEVVEAEEVPEDAEALEQPQAENSEQKDNKGGGERPGVNEEK